jgi:hypothetical protein
MAVGLSTYAFWQHSMRHPHPLSLVQMVSRAGEPRKVFFQICDLISAPEASHREEEA